jgi:hypothetical protein
MKWNGIVDFSPSAPSTVTNTAGNVRNLVMHKGGTFPTGTSIPQSGQMFFYTGTSTASTPTNTMFNYTGSSWAMMGGGGLTTGKGTESPNQFPASPQTGDLWYATDTSKMYCFTGLSGYSGANAAGWFNLMQSVYGS